MKKPSSCVGIDAISVRFIDLMSEKLVAAKYKTLLIYEVDDHGHLNFIPYTIHIF
jgi:hypothetical protein